MEFDTKKTVCFRSVKYQKSTDKCSWHKFHIRLDEGDSIADITTVSKEVNNNLEYNEDAQDEGVQETLL